MSRSLPVTSLAQEDAPTGADHAGIQEFIEAVGSINAIALGVLCGYPLYRSIARSLGWLSEPRPVLP